MSEYSSNRLMPGGDGANAARVTCRSFGVFRLGLVASIGMLLASEPYTLSSARGLRPAPRWVRERIVNVPDLYFSSNSHILSSRERQKLAQIAPVLQGASS